ncbi:AlbA family DNA-binding domain-containing protein [Dyadobacter diqingensis]|jgi:predicted HTH transcriptional regulator|uniref:AlbA family DNA-binding domain-containing protein n=1 Tax=Dyadobacter diqingensis TaxID=2938121 RepID=UPI0020C33DBB|nr:ATP-binding protein [Dyadobacter diqingensis]
MIKSTIQLIKEGEGLTVEFKRTIDSPYKIAKTIASFANTSGGVLLVGVGDNRELLGIKSELNELEKLEKACTELVDKMIPVRFKSEKLDNRILLRVEIDESQERPHYAINEKGQRMIYIRVKDKSVPTLRLFIEGESDIDTKTLLASRHVRTLVQYLKEYDSISAKVFSRIINISEKRAERMMNDLAEKQVLLKLKKGKPELYSLKWVE